MSVLITGMGVTIVNVMLPAIQRDLHVRLSGLHWVLDAENYLETNSPRAKVVFSLGVIALQRG
jgi:hypothetical protein